MTRAAVDKTLTFLDSTGETYETIISSASTESSVGVSVDNTTNTTLISGTDYGDTISNSGTTVTIQALVGSAGNDYIYNNVGANSNITALALCKVFFVKRALRHLWRHTRKFVSRVKFIRNFFSSGRNPGTHVEILSEKLLAEVDTMALLEIKKAGDPVLKQICTPVEKLDKRFRNFLDDLAETMYKSEGIGIAAPQVGVLSRACVIDVDKKSRYDLINPVITWREGRVVDNEGCLSCPDLFGDVERAEKVRVEYLNRFGKKKTLEADGLLARCIQHELDHLDGKLFIDIAQNLTKGKRHPGAKGELAAVD